MTTFEQRDVAQRMDGAGVSLTESSTSYSILRITEILHLLTVHELGLHFKSQHMQTRYEYDRWRCLYTIGDVCFPAISLKHKANRVQAGMLLCLQRKATPTRRRDDHMPNFSFYSTN